MKPVRRITMVLALASGLLALLFLLLALHPARADTGPALEESTVIGSMVSPYKFKHTRVRMVDEQVRLKVAPVTAEGKIYHQVDVQADFHFYNTSTISETMQAVFPLTDLKCPWVAGPGSWKFREDVIDEPSFRVAVEGQPVATEPVTTTTVITQTFAGGPPPMQLECLTNWKSFDVVFPPRQDVRIQVGYRMQPTFELGSGMTGYPWDSFTYILKTGAPWYGTIGQVDFSIELPYPPQRVDFLKLPPGYRLQEKTLRWRWRNLEPTQNFQVVMLSSQTQKDLAETLEKVKTDPKDAGAWARLAGIYESMAAGYDYPFSCGSSIDYATFPEPRNWVYTRLSQRAYQKALELRPDDGETRTSYANLLAEMSLSANRGVLLAGYPSVQRVLQEFEAALALEKAERTQQLLDSYQHCIVKSKVDPPVCQCGF